MQLQGNSKCLEAPALDPMRLGAQVPCKAGSSWYFEAQNRRLAVCGWASSNARVKLIPRPTTEFLALGFWSWAPPAGSKSEVDSRVSSLAREDDMARDGNMGPSMDGSWMRRVNGRSGMLDPLDPKLSTLAFVAPGVVLYLINGGLGNLPAVPLST